MPTLTHAQTSLDINVAWPQMLYAVLVVTLVDTVNRTIAL